MIDENRDLLDLCRLNLMEETVEESPGNDRDSTLDAIDWKRRQLIVRIAAEMPELSAEELDRHIVDNTVEGVYLKEARDQ